MRKKKGRKAGEQLSLFERPVVNFCLDDGLSSGTTKDHGVSYFYSQLARNRAFTETLLDTVMSANRLNEAYERVRKNKGSSGVDGMSTDELGVWLKSHSKSLIRSVLTETYQPEQVLGIEIPKPNGGKRLLGIPTVLDRMIQHSIHHQLELFYDPLFSDHSYGFRSGRSSHDAIKQSFEYVSSGHEWVVDIDLKNFFDHINQDRLMQRLSKGIGDKRLLRLIHKYLRSGLLLDGLTTQRTSGAPQGGPLSPILSNIVLDELDKELEKRAHKFVRYADDCNIYVKSEKSGHRVLASITRFIEERLKLKVNRTKSGVRRCEAVNFLGYTVMPQGIRVSDKSLARLRNQVIKVTKRNRGVRFSRIIQELNPKHRGWINYFRLANIWLPWKALDSWIRHRLRCYRLRQCGRHYTMFKLLHKRMGGSDYYTSKIWNAIKYGGKWWHLSNKQVCNQAFNVQWFSKQGLSSLSDLHNRLKN